MDLKQGLKRLQEERPKRKHDSLPNVGGGDVRCKKSVLSHRSVRLKELTKDRACGPLTLLLHTGIARDSDLPIPPGGVSHVNKRRSSLQAASKNASGKWQGEKS